MASSGFFKVGGRYENRLGWYTVAQIGAAVMSIRYDSGLCAAIDDLAQQERIVTRLATERLTPTKPKPTPQPVRTGKGWRRDPTDAAAFFFGLGFLASRAHIEAHVPQKNQREFEEDYTLCTGQTLVPGQDMYYIFPDPDIKKWGPDLRAAWRGTDAECDTLNFGQGIAINYDESAGQYRINKSVFVRDLFTRGFRMGAYQNLVLIGAKVPGPFQDAFQFGVVLGRDRGRDGT